MGGAVHRQGAGPDDCSGRERDRKRRGVHGGQDETSRSGDHHAVDHPTIPAVVSERIEVRPEPRHLSDEGERDEVAG
jgi:hypothetical protein